MKISGINLFYTKFNVDKNKKQKQDAKKENVSFGTNNTMKNVSKAAILAAGIAHLPLSVMGAYPMNATQNKNTLNYGLVENASEDINEKYNIDSLLSKEGINNKIQLRNINLKTMPVSEFYTTSKKKSVTLKPDKDIERNENGAVLYNIKEEKTLNEIIDDVYSDALSNYGKESEKTAVKNKMIDEIIQSNPTLAKNIDREAKSYEELGNKKVTADLAGSKMLNIPTAIAYQTYGEEVARAEFYNSSKTYTPSSVTASVVRETEILLSDEYGSFEELIYGTYGDDISNEAYRDIAYAIVNSPLNAPEFEVVLEDTDFNELAQAGNINDLNRLLKENTSDTMIGLDMPVVTTLSSTAENTIVKGGNKNGVVYQLSPAAVNEGDNDRVIEIKSNADGILTSGEVTALKDVVQYYSSPDGRGRFATVKNGETVLNTKVNYVKEFASQIMQQVVYANLEIFTAQYEDKDGVHKYGVFDVNPGYDTKGKTIEEIISNSQINTQRMNNYSFVDENGNSKFEAGTELKLPQFNYRINTSAKLQTVIQEPVVKEPEIITPTKAETPTTAPTIAPTKIEDPTTTPTIAPTQEEAPTTAPTPPEGTYVKGLDGNYYKVTSELKEVIKFTTTSGETIIITTEEDDEGFVINGFPVYGKRLPDTDENGSILFQSEDGNWYYVEPESIPSQTEDGFVLVKGEDGKWYYADPSEIEEPTTTPTAAPTAVEDPTTTPTIAPSGTEEPTIGTTIKGADGKSYQITSEIAVEEVDGVPYEIPDEYKNVDYRIIVIGSRAFITNMEGRKRSIYPAASSLDDGSVLFQGEDGKWYYGIAEGGETTPTIAPTQEETPTTAPTPPEGTYIQGTDGNFYEVVGNEQLIDYDGKAYQVYNEYQFGCEKYFDEEGNEYWILPAPERTENGVLTKGQDGNWYYVAEDAVPSKTEDGFVLEQGEDGKWYYAAPSGTEEPTTTPTTAPSTGTEEPTTTPTTAPSTGTEEPTTTPTVAPTTAPTAVEEPTTTPTIAPTESEEPSTSGSSIKGTDGKSYKITSAITVVEYDGVLYEIPDQYKNVDYEIYVDIAGKNEANPVYFIPKGDHMEGRQVRIYPAASSLDDGSILFQGEDGNWYYGKALAEITAPTDIDEPIVGPTNIVSPTEVIGGIEVPTTTPTTAPTAVEDPTTTPSTAPSTETEDPTTSTAPSTETDEPITIPTTTPTVAPSGTEVPTTPITVPTTDITFGDIENPTIDGVLSTEEPNSNETIISGGVIIQKTLPTTDGDIGTK